jgi:hypothetical protein
MESLMRHSIRTGIAVIALSAVVACTDTTGPRQQLPITPPQDRPAAPVVRTPLPQPPAGSTVPPVVPEGAVYVCVVDDAQGQRRQMVVEFSSPQVRELCRKNPEMGPCKYERDACRRSGGRVYAAGGMEITAQTETDYDKKVLRVRLKSN